MKLISLCSEGVLMNMTAPPCPQDGVRRFVTVAKAKSARQCLPREDSGHELHPLGGGVADARWSANANASTSSTKDLAEADKLKINRDLDGTKITQMFYKQAKKTNSSVLYCSVKPVDDLT